MCVCVYLHTQTITVGFIMCACPALHVLVLRVLSHECSQPAHIFLPSPLYPLLINHQQHHGPITVSTSSKQYKGGWAWHAATGTTFPVKSYLNNVVVSLSASAAAIVLIHCSRVGGAGGACGTQAFPGSPRMTGRKSM